VGGVKRLTAESLAALHKDLRRSPRDRVLVLVHLGTCGLASGAQEVLDAVASAAEELGSAGVRIKTTGCAGLCSREPMITVVAAGAPPVKYGDLNPTKARRIYSEHVVGGKPVAEYTLGAGSEGTY
jgi:NADP-reducing hydrogenase subunit HndB